MKTYNKPQTKFRKAFTEPYALDIHTGVGESEQLGNEARFEDDATIGSQKSVWDE
jgi:hypothetical protein